MEVIPSSRKIESYLGLRAGRSDEVVAIANAIQSPAANVEDSKDSFLSFSRPAMSAPTLSERYSEAQAATKRALGVLNAFRNPLGEPPSLVEGRLRCEAEADYADAVAAEGSAQRAYEAEMLILILPYPSYGFIKGKYALRAGFKVLGKRANVPSGTSAEILIYGVSELGLADYTELAKECNNLLSYEDEVEYDLSVAPYNPVVAAVGAAKAHYAVRAILDSAPRLGFLRAPSAVDAAGGAGAGAGAS